MLILMISVLFLFQQQARIMGTGGLTSQLLVYRQLSFQGVLFLWLMQLRTLQHLHLQTKHQL